MRDHPIVVTRADAAQLRGLLANHALTGHDQDHLQELAGELERARIADSEDVPADVITIQTHVRLLDLVTGARRELTLVLPRDADASAGRISVLAPLGTALLGTRAGDEVEWQMPGGWRRLLIEAVRAADEPVRPVAVVDEAVPG